MNENIERAKGRLIHTACQYGVARKINQNTDLAKNPAFKEAFAECERELKRAADAYFKAVSQL